MNCNKKKQVYDILMTPIKYSGTYEAGNVYEDYKIEETKIFKEGSVIKSTQSYYPCYKNGKRYKFSPDPDMTDFTCGFYEIIYKDILNDLKMVKEDGNLSNGQFAGDSMNGFNYIANGVPKAGETAAKRTPYNTWPDFLQKYYDHYHCLANFWLLPKEIGRKNDNCLSKGHCAGAQDYMDRFLNQVKRNWGKYCEGYATYFQAMKEFNEFAEINFLVGSYIHTDMSVFEYSQNTPEEIIYALQDRMRLRATAISESKYCEELWTYFCNCGLIT